MESLRQKCADRALSAKPKVRQKPEDELFDKLQSGDLMELLTLEAQYDLGQFIERNEYVDNKEEFVVIFHIPVNKFSDALFCLCKMDLSGDEPKIFVRHAIPALYDESEFNGFELNSCDLELRI